MGFDGLNFSLGKIGVYQFRSSDYHYGMLDNCYKKYRLVIFYTMNNWRFFFVIWISIFYLIKTEITDDSRNDMLSFSFMLAVSKTDQFLASFVVNNVMI